MDACQGKPFLLLVTISLAAGVSRETTPAAVSWPPSARMESVWPTPFAASWPERMGRFWLGMDNPARSPPANKIEQGCLLRARKRLQQRIPVLCQLLDQQLPTSARGDLSTFWQALRKIASLADMLVQLAEDFKTSLLAHYRSLDFALGT